MSTRAAEDRTMWEGMPQGFCKVKGQTKVDYVSIFTVSVRLTAAPSSNKRAAMSSYPRAELICKAVCMS